MTRGIWGDRERYLETYWGRFPGVWTHGDWASIDGDGDWFLHGRSDDTLNVAGKRIGPAEYESALVGDPAVAEACAVGVPHEVKGEVVWCFCVLRAGTEPDEALRTRLRERCAQELGKAFAPAEVRFTRPCPRRAAPRSCAAPCARRCSGRIRATSRRSRIRARSRPCAPAPRVRDVRWRLLLPAAAAVVAGAALVSRAEAMAGRFSARSGRTPCRCGPVARPTGSRSTARRPGSEAPLPMGCRPT